MTLSHNAYVMRCTVNNPDGLSDYTDNDFNKTHELFLVTNRPFKKEEDNLYIRFSRIMQARHAILTVADKRLLRDKPFVDVHDFFLTIQEKSPNEYIFMLYPRINMSCQFVFGVSGDEEVFIKAKHWVKLGSVLSTILEGKHEKTVPTILYRRKNCIVVKTGEQTKDFKKPFNGGALTQNDLYSPIRSGTGMVHYNTKIKGVRNATS